MGSIHVLTLSISPLANKLLYLPSHPLQTLLYCPASPHQPHSSIPTSPHLPTPAQCPKDTPPSTTNSSQMPTLTDNPKFVPSTYRNAASQCQHTDSSTKSQACFSNCTFYQLQGLHDSLRLQSSLASDSIGSFSNVQSTQLCAIESKLSYCLVSCSIKRQQLAASAYKYLLSWLNSDFS